LEEEWVEIIDHEVQYKKPSEKFYIIGLGDIHLGSAGCDRERLQEIIDYIKVTKNCFWIGMGDYAECINPADPRFDPRSVDKELKVEDLSDLVSKQYQIVKKLLNPIKDRCIALLSGNHEELIRLKYYRDIALDLARDLKTSYLGYCGFIRLHFRRHIPGSFYHGETYLIFVAHGTGNARTSGAKINRIERLAEGFLADIVMIAHEHKKIIAPPILGLTVPLKGEKKLIEKKRLAIMTGGFLKGYVQGATSYIERKMYSPSDLGCVKIIVEPEKRNLHASL
jgi:hypothetical protein